MIKAIGLYLSYSKHDGRSTYNKISSRSSCLVVVSPGYEIAANILERRIDNEEAWNRIFIWVADACKTDSCIINDRAGHLLSLLESCSALQEEHNLHFSNLVPKITKHAVDMMEKSGQGRDTSCSCYILDKMCSRGFSEMVVETLLALYSCSGDHRTIYQSILKGFPQSGHGSKPFVTALLDQVSKMNPNLIRQNSSRAMVMRDFVPTAVWDTNTKVQLQLGDVLITKGSLHKESLSLLIEYLDLMRSNTTLVDDPVMMSLERAVTAWSSKDAVNRMTLYQQKALANFIIHSLRLISKDNLESREGFIPSVLKGISLYLGSPRESLRHIGMCIGNALSGILSPDKPPIFLEEGIENSILLDTSYIRVSSAQTSNPKKVVIEKQNDDIYDPDSDDETDSEFGYQEDLEEMDEKNPDRLLQLHEIVKLLNSNDDKWKDQLEAISLCSDLIKALPSELDLYAEALARGLIYCRLPNWANEEIENPNIKCFDEQRIDAILALVTMSPEKAGSCLIDVFYSASSNIEHRARSLQLLSRGAKSISMNCLSSSIENGERLKNSQHAAESKPELPGILLDWSAKLLCCCDKQKHGINLFGKDSHLLGCLLCTLGNFLEILCGSHEALYLATAVLKLVQSTTVKNHEELFVRRSALAAAAQSVSSVPSSSICLAMADNVVGVADGQGISATSKEFVALLDKGNLWFQDVIQNDSDHTCQKLGQGCTRLVELLTMDALDKYSKQYRQISSFDSAIKIHSLEALKSHQETICIQIPGKEIVKPEQNSSLQRL